MICGYGLRVVSGPTIEPVTVDEAAAHAQIDADLLLNAQVQANLAGWIRAGREKAEAFTGLAFVERTLELSLRAFPGPCEGDEIQFPIGPVLSVDSVTYLQASDGQPVTLAGTDYELLEQAKRWLLLPKFPKFWPYTPRRPNGVLIQYRAGYPSAGSPADVVNVPELAKLAIKQYVAHFSENRESVVAETRIVPAQVPDTFWDLLQSLRVYP